ncbi:alpha/beta hydrolase [Plastorhodobacter daqingensis]|uniref:Palmitoyl-protein thioesterase ABHD10, mitochondrial n=1 Tax=Plastorhodobacter daqingensis TaxID=1387281 RepID=A0ABW2UKD3_9RHOB
MSQPSFHQTAAGRRIAYHRLGGQGGGVVFLGGFRSDMEGTKAQHLAAWAKARRAPFLRFDYSGHGASSGAFLDGAISDWADDACEAISALTEGPQILVGSSMGGWISLLVAQAMPEKVAGIIGIAAAPDFTEDMWAAFDAEQRAQLLREGVVNLPSDYSDEPYAITRRLIEDGRNSLVLQSPLPLTVPVRFLQGTADTDVPVSVALRLLEHATGPDIRLTLVKGADHRFSTPDCLDLVAQTLEELLG